MSDPKDFSRTAANNTSVGGVNIAEGAATADMNNSQREALATIGTADGSADFGSFDPAILIDHIGESTPDAGVTIDGLLIKDGGLPDLNTGTIIQPGAMLPTVVGTPWAGWLMMNGDTIGDAGSGADQSSADYEALYAAMWDNVIDTWAPVTGGRGLSAAADWAALKPLQLVNPIDRNLIGAGNSYVSGEQGGSATATIEQANLPEVDLELTLAKRFGSNQGSGFGFGADTGVGTNSTGLIPLGGSGTGLPVLNPFMGVFFQVKY